MEQVERRTDIRKHSSLGERLGLIWGGTPASKILKITRCLWILISKGIRINRISALEMEFARQRPIGWMHKTLLLHCFSEKANLLGIAGTCGLEHGIPETEKRL